MAVQQINEFSFGGEIMEVQAKFNAKTMAKLQDASDEVVYAIARRMIDQVGNLKATAYRTGETERSMFSHGVGKDDKGYYIGNFTNYAKYVYKMKNVNWTNPSTRPRWFESVWKEYGEMIEKECAERYLDD